VSCLSPNGPWMGRSGSPGLAGGDTKSLANGHGLGTNSMLWSRRLVGTHVRLFVRSGHKPTIELMGTVQNSTVQYSTEQALHLQLQLQLWALAFYCVVLVYRCTFPFFNFYPQISLSSLSVGYSFQTFLIMGSLIRLHACWSGDRERDNERGGDMRLTIMFTSF
jgi:uncharacterized membrane protein